MEMDAKLIFETQMRDIFLTLVETGRKVNVYIVLRVPKEPWRSYLLSDRVLPKNLYG